MVAECQQYDEVFDESIDFPTGIIEMTNNETVVPTITHINTQECRSYTETEPNTD